ncbi:MAG: hypothetical protein KBT47_03390 [Armatimonadetes bacterium]|nr:hypothetical protein [Candidatus Hippobium faecium]
MKKVFLLVLLIIASLSAFSQTIEKVSDAVYKITGDNYVATTEPYFGGYLGSFVVDGEEFLENSVVETKGCCISGGVYKAPALAKADSIEVSGNSLILTTALGTMIYEAYPDRLEVSVTPAGGCVSYFFLNGGIKFAKSGNEYRKLPFMDDTPGEYIWIKNKAGIKTEGDAKYWGPWHLSQVAELSLGENATKKFVLTPIKLSEKDIAQALDVPSQNDLYVYSPLNYQVFQRQTKNKGKILFSGRVSENVSDISYRISGKDLNNRQVNSNWKKLKCTKYGEFNDFVEFNAGGWYKAELKYKIGNKEYIKIIDNVGIGEIIIGAGQSNSTNCSQCPTKTETGMVSNTNGTYWRLADDPQMATHDGSGGGSLYPSLGDALYREFNVPVGVVPTGWGGTNVAKWLPDAEAVPHSLIKGYTNLYDFMMTRVFQFGPKGFRCILWHQGESDAGCAPEYYFDSMSKIIWQSRKDAGWNIPWFTAQATYLVEPSASTREGQKMLWDKGVSFPGPDTDQWVGEEYRDGNKVHFNAYGLKVHGEAWAKIIADYIHAEID